MTKDAQNTVGDMFRSHAYCVVAKSRMGKSSNATQIQSVVSNAK